MCFRVVIQNDEGRKELHDNSDANGLVWDTEGGRIDDMINLVLINFFLHVMKEHR